MIIDKDTIKEIARIISSFLTCVEKSMCKVWYTGDATISNEKIMLAFRWSKIDIDEDNMGLVDSFTSILEEADSPYVVVRTWHGYWIPFMRPVFSKIKMHYDTLVRYAYYKIGLYNIDWIRIIPKKPVPIRIIKYNDDKHCIYSVYKCLEKTHKIVIEKGLV